MTTIRDLATKTFDVLTSNDLSPSTRDLMTVEGIRIGEWADAPGERGALLDEILAEYEAAARAAGNQMAVSEIMEIRWACKPTEDEMPDVGLPAALAATIHAALTGDSNDAEHDALVDVAHHFGIEVG